MKREEINARLGELSDGFRYLADLDELDEIQRAQFDEATTEFEELEARRADIAERDAAAERVAAVPSLQVIVKPSTEDVLNDRSASAGSLADTVTRSLDDHDVDSTEARTTLKRNAKKDPEWARKLAVRSSDVYSSAWSKMMTGQEMFLDEAERAAAAVGTNTAGGFLVPTHLDPTLIFTNTGTTNAVRGVSRVVQLTTGNVWNGVTTAGSSFSFDAELAEVSDDTPSFGRVSIPLFAARGFVQASLEMLLDTDVTGDLAAIFADGKDRLEATNYILGAGSSSPKGIVVCLDANTNDELATTTANALGAVDIDAAYRHVGPRWRGRGTWLMNPLFEGKIRLLATTLGSQFTTDLTGAYTSVLYNKPVIEADEMPALLTTTGQNIAVYGDFSQFLIVDQPGSYSLQYIPALFNTSNNLPDGRVGWFASWRTGSKSVNDVAFTLLQNA